jgi:hypothetical protein
VLDIVFLVTLEKDIQVHEIFVDIEDKNIAMNIYLDRLSC